MKIAFKFLPAAILAGLIAAGPAQAATTFTGITDDSAVASESFSALEARWVWSASSEITSTFSLTASGPFSVTLDFYDPVGHESLLTLIYVHPIDGNTALDSHIASSGDVGSVMFSASLAGNYLISLSDSGQTSGDVRISLQPVPLPAPALLMGAALAAIGGIAARRRSPAAG